MIRFFLSLLVMLFTLLANAQAKQTHTIAGKVTKLVASMPVEVNVDTNSESTAVRVEGVQTDIEKITVKQVGSVLYIDMSTKKNKNKVIYNSKIKVFIAQPKIVDYDISTAVRVHADGRVQGNMVTIKADAASSLNANFTANTVNVNLDSASKYEGDIIAKNIKVSIDSAAKVILTGDTENLVVIVDSAAKFDGKNLKAKFVKVEADSMGKAEVYPIESLNAYADSMGKVIYYNTPKELKKYTDSMGSVKSN